MKWHELSQWRSEMAAVHKVHLELHVGKNTEPSSTGLIIHLPRSIAAHPNDPLDVSVFDQAQSIGLVQGMAGFTMQFCPDEECQALTTRKHKLSFFSPDVRWN